jgi:hypothetical protein
LLTFETATFFLTHCIKPEKVYLPPLSRKLGLIKRFVRAMDQINARSRYLKIGFPG